MQSTLVLLLGLCHLCYPFITQPAFTRFIISSPYSASLRISSSSSSAPPPPAPPPIPQFSLWPAPSTPFVSLGSTASYSWLETDTCLNVWLPLFLPPSAAESLTSKDISLSLSPSPSGPFSISLLHHPPRPPSSTGAVQPPTPPLLHGILKGVVDPEGANFVLERDGVAFNAYAGGGGGEGLGLVVCLELDKVDIFKRFQDGHVMPDRPLLFEGDNDWVGVLQGEAVQSLTVGRVLCRDDGGSFFEEEDEREADLDVRKYIVEELGIPFADGNKTAAWKAGGETTRLGNGAMIDTEKLKKELFSTSKMTDRIGGILKDLNEKIQNVEDEK